MMPVHSVDSAPRPTSSSCAPGWDSVMGRHTPQITTGTGTGTGIITGTAAAAAVGVAAATSPTPRRIVPAARALRSPIVTTHQPYRELPLSVIGVDSELQSYADSSENALTVKAAYKSGVQRMRPASTQSFAAAAASASSLRSSQRSPITAFDGNGDAHVGADLTAAPSSLATTIPHMVLGLSATRAVRGSANKRIVSLDLVDHYTQQQQHASNNNNNNSISNNNNNNHYNNYNNNNNIMMNNSYNNNSNHMHMTSSTGNSVPSAYHNMNVHASSGNHMSHSSVSASGVVSGGAATTHDNAGAFVEPLRCPVSLHLVMAEEKHLNYTGVDLPADELNLGDTVERARRLQQRRRQMQYGKETAGYANYISAIPNRGDREFRNPMHPMTPRPEHNCSKRTFDRYLNIWRRQLHLWDDYNAEKLQSPYVRIGIPTLRQLGLELPPSTPDGHQSGLLSFTPIAASNGNSGGTSCTPVVPRHIRRDIIATTTTTISTANATTAPPPPPPSFQRMSGLFQNGAGTPVTMPHNMRPSSGCGGASWSITNTPHTPYHTAGMSCHGSTHSNGSYPPLLSVLAQPTICSPHCFESSRQSSPNQHSGKRGSMYYPVLGNGAGAATAATTATAAAAAAAANNNNNHNVHSNNTTTTNNNNNNNLNGNAVGSAAAAAAAASSGGGTYWESSGVVGNTTNNNNNNNNYYYGNPSSTAGAAAGTNSTGYSYRSYGSPYGGHRYTPHATPGHHYLNYYANNSFGTTTTTTTTGTTATVCVGNEQWRSPHRQAQ